ncbi:MAG: A/G-specific adenine glycosylase [Alphaproteobacteria bacterium]|nr:MAG: A/G-specific adenine glycosylase [Alphaproteobacteria bacterium]
MQTKLLTWYDKNKRAFPWRSDKPNPYHVWLSEIMLQQTTTVTVVPYFLRFVDKYPTLQALKKASLEDVYFLWQGLGYYSRARNLYKTAQLVDEFPKKREDLVKLPGIGPYTSAAIAAIAFDEKVVPVDGNVRRVLSRFYGLEEVCGPALDKVIEDKVKCERRPGDFCQALMDLSRQICLPKNPKCEACPLKNLCKKQIHLPNKAPKLVKKVMYTKAFIVERDGKIFLVKNQNTGLLKNLWSVPMLVFSDTPYMEQEGFIKQIKHVFTHIELYVDVYKSNTVDETTGKWVKDILEVPTSTLLKKVIGIA